MRTEDIPETPSKLIYFAAECSQKIDRKLYRPNWGFYHFSRAAIGNSTPFCHVCFAGMVMARLADDPTRGFSSALDFRSARAAGKLWALDNFRRGEVGEAFRDLKIPYDLPYNLEFPPIKRSQFVGWKEFDLFIGEMKYLAAILERYGH